MKNIDKMLNEIASQGRYGDTMLAHINPQEAEILKALGGSGTINPKTGLPEFWGFSIGPIGIGSSYGGVSVGNVSTGDIYDATVGEVYDTLEDETKAAGRWIDQKVRDEIPGGWATVALLTAGYYYSPEISAYVSADGATTVAASDVAAADAAYADAAATAGAENAAAWSTGADLASADLAAISADAAAADAAYVEAAQRAAAENAAAGFGATDAEISAAAKSMASNGVTFKQALDGVRAGLLINSLTGDPLGLGGDTGGGGGGATGFQMQPIPDWWRSPTYAAPSAPIDLESIFSNQNMLGGTQWQDLPTQQNISFNDIFAAGQQQTPMGTPVDINQIVGSILGQTTTR